VIVISDEFVTLDTPNGPMRTHIVRPAAPGRYPGIVFYSEIFQITAPIRRTAAFFAGHGHIVAMPEIYHEFEPAGTVFAYDQAGSDRGNALKTTKKLASYDADARAALDHLAARPDCTGKLGALGICIGGHLAFRAAMNPDVLGAACFYATDIHKGGIGEGMHDDSLECAKDIRGELLMIWGRQDPHIPLEGPHQGARSPQRAWLAPQLARGQRSSRVYARRRSTVRSGAGLQPLRNCPHVLSPQTLRGRPASRCSRRRRDPPLEILFCSVSGQKTD
jgi:carboxymethylenebutenolidase